MKTVAVICEYNPFHGGHAYLFEQIRKVYGEDSAIVCIMSGNFTQRGEAATVRKQVRAAIATEGGADLVLELPFPYSSSAAERFARAGVHIAASLGCVDVLAFGAENANAELLTAVARRLNSPEYREAYFAADASLGSANKCEAVYRSLYGEGAELAVLRSPNNLLGIEYIRAILAEGAKIEPCPILRVGAGHDKDGGENELYPSGKSIRDAWESGDKDALSRLPYYSAEAIETELSERKSLADNKIMLTDLLMQYRLNSPDTYRDADGMGGGLFARIQRAAQDACDGTDFFNRLKTKKYTDAFLRRALLTGVFGIDREILNRLPSYTQVLAMSEVGQKLLAKIRKTAQITILTKPGDAKDLPAPTREEAFLTMRADSLYSALFRVPFSPADTVRYRPYRKKSQS